LSRAAAVKTPASTRSATLRNPPSSVISNVPSVQTKSPSKIPSRVPLGNLQHGHNSPERRKPAMMSAPQCQPPTSEHSIAQSTGVMGPPRAPPPKMRSLHEPTAQFAASTMPVRAQDERPHSVLSSSMSQTSSRNVRPTSPEDVYDDRERMSYVSASLIGQSRPYEQASRMQDSQLDHSYLNRSHLNHHSQMNAAQLSTSIHGHHEPPVSRQTSNFVFEHDDRHNC